MQFLPLNRYLLDNHTPFKHSYVRSYWEQFNQSPVTQDDQANGDTFARREELPIVFDPVAPDPQKSDSSKQSSLMASLLLEEEPLNLNGPLPTKSSSFWENLPDLSGPTRVEFPGCAPFDLPALEFKRFNASNNSMEDFGNPFADLRMEIGASPESPEASPQAERTQAKKPFSALAKRRAELAIKREALLKDYTQGETDARNLAEAHGVTRKNANQWIRKSKEKQSAESLLVLSRSRGRQPSSSKRKAGGISASVRLLKRSNNRKTSPEKCDILTLNPEKNLLEVEHPFYEAFVPIH